MSETKIQADLIAGFGGVKFIPMPIVFATNNFNPKLILHEHHMEYRGGFITRKLNYQDVEKIDVFIHKERTNNIVVFKKNSIWTFIGNFRERNQLKEFLLVLEQKGCVLTEDARKEIQ